jgi:hypothetical protein
MDEAWSPSRRRLLVSQCGLGTLAGLAGCTDSSDETDGGTEEEGTDDEASTDSETSDGSSSEDADSGGTAGEEDTAGSDTGDLDLREANVVDVTFEAQNGSYAFDVTLHHDDSGEDGYANWWQVETIDGERLGRRELLHAHSQQPFTRSETIEIPDGTACVVVRGHDQTHGYGGQSIVVALDSGATKPIDQGPDAQSVDASQCP